MPELYERIRSRREELGLSQEELAMRMGYKSRSSINKIELGENDIPYSKIKYFAAALETTTSELLGLTDKLIEDIAFEMDIPKEKINLIVNSNNVSSVNKIMKVAKILDNSPKPAPKSEHIGSAKQKLLDAVDDMSEAEMAILFERIQKIKESRI